MSSSRASFEWSSPNNTTAEFVLLFHNDVLQALDHAELADRLRQTALFFESMEAAVDKGIRNRAGAWLLPGRRVHSP